MLEVRYPVDDKTKESPAPTYPYVYDPKVPGRRIFDDAAVQKNIDAKLATLPADAHGVVLFHGDVDGQGNWNVSKSIVAKLNDHWSLVESTDLGKTTGLKEQVEVRLVW